MQHLDERNPFNLEIARDQRVVVQDAQFARFHQEERGLLLDISGPQEVVKAEQHPRVFRKPVPGFHFRVYNRRALGQLVDNAQDACVFRGLQTSPGSCCAGSDRSHVFLACLITLC